MYELKLEEGERINITFEAEHDLDFAFCTPSSYKKWRTTGKLTGALHHARRTRNLSLTLVAKTSGARYVLIIIEICIKNATVNAKKGEARIGVCSPVVSLATFESGRWNG